MNISFNNLFGHIVIIDFPFAESAKKKRRPALILLSSRHNNFIIAQITSAKSELPAFDLPLENWLDYNLQNPSTVRLDRLHTVHQSRVLGYIGELNQADKLQIREKLQKMW